MLTRYLICQIKKKFIYEYSIIFKANFGIFYIKSQLIIWRKMYRN